MIPQDTVLGPTLFSISMNDLVHSAGFPVRLFADDTALILNDSNLCELERKVNLEIKKLQHG